MTQKILLKDILFNKVKVEQIAGEIHRVHRSFKAKEFVREVVARFPELELKARIAWIAECLARYLPSEYRAAVCILLKALPPPNSPDLLDDDFGDFIYASYAEYVTRHGCTKERLHAALNALYEITQRFSAEDAIRPFLNAFPKETLATLKRWSKDPHYHVRRLCSEGTRPKLPWSQKITIPVSAPLPLLDTLFSDKARFVTRSVANHLNDISKTNPQVVIDTLAKWRKSRKQKPAEMEYIVRHSLRTLVKQGNENAMCLLGYSPAAEVSLWRLNVPREVKRNHPLEFSFTVSAKEETDVIVDYSLYFQNSSGALSRKKVFKLTKLSLMSNKPVVISKRHLLRELMSTRRLFPGRHEIEIQINGKAYQKRSFKLV